MELSIGDEKYEVPRLKVKKLRLLLALVDQAHATPKIAEGLDYTMEFYHTLLGDEYRQLTVEYLEEHMDAFMCSPGYFNRVMVELMAEPGKDESGEDKAEKTKR